MLLRGPSGAGKSDLALRLIEGGARLVADDQVEVRHIAQALKVTSPASLSGLLEVRGIGIVTMPCCSEAVLRLVIDLVAREEVVRLPDPAHVAMLGIQVPCLALDAFAASTPAKVRLALDLVLQGTLFANAVPLGPAA